MRALLLPLVLVAGCASDAKLSAPMQWTPQNELMSDRGYAGGALEPGADMAADMAADKAVDDGLLAENAPARAEPEVRTDALPASRRLIIYTARFAILVPSAEAAADKFLAAAEAAGGYLGSRNDQQIVVRVPAAQFSALVDSLGDYGAITSRQVTAEDVTAAFRDLKIRIENAERGRDRLLKLLENATDTKALLEIEKELRRLTEEIEVMKGQLRHMSDQIAYSTITVQFLEDAPSPRPVSVRRESRFPWINRIGVEHALERF